MFQQYNANPKVARVGDCTVRAISKALDKSWDEVYIGLALQGFVDKDMPSSNAVWGNYLRGHGFERRIIPNTCPDCYTVADFSEDHKHGSYILALSGHVVAVKDGVYFDTFDSGENLPIFYWSKED